MFKNRSQEPELMDDTTLSGPGLAQNLTEISATNRWFGARTVLITALNLIYKKYKNDFKNKISIADLGCGAGDLFIAMDRWAIKKKLAIEFIGIDVNSFMLDHAKNQVKILSPVQYIEGNILEKSFIQSLSVDISCLNSITHHFTDKEFIKLLQELYTQTRKAIIINDLRRNSLAYYGIKVIAKIFNFCYLTQHDAPLSVLRSFRKNELIDVLTKAGLKSFQIRRAWAFRWQIIIWCKKDVTHENQDRYSYHR